MKKSYLYHTMQYAKKNPVFSLIIIAKLDKSIIENNTKFCFNLCWKKYWIKNKKWKKTKQNWISKSKHFATHITPPLNYNGQDIALNYYFLINSSPFSSYTELFLFVIVKLLFFFSKNTSDGCFSRYSSDWLTKPYEKKEHLFLH